MAYSLGAAALLSGRYLPTVIEWGAWGLFESARGVRWIMWGQTAEDDRLRRLVREAVRAELAASRGELPEGELRYNTPIRRRPRRLEG